MADDRNPYMDDTPRRRRGAHFASEVQPMVPAAPPRRKRSFKPLLIVLLLAALAAGGYFGWQRFGADIIGRLGIGGKRVQVTVNGESAYVPEGSTVQAVYEAVKPEVAAGDLKSVGGNVLKEGGGDLFAATLDGQNLNYAESATATVTEGASITFADGADACEEYASETVVTSQPKLVRKVKEGTEETNLQQTGTIQYIYQWGKEGTKEVRTGSISGETADGNIVEGQDCIIMCQNVHPDDNEKLVALTFDDGPGIYTDRYLQILDDYGIKATFNLIGEQVEDCADIVSRNCASGNQICSHTWSHPLLTTATQDSLLAQLDDTSAVIKKVGNYDTSTIRAPYGALSIDVWLKSQGHMTLSVCWSHDSLDWEQPGVNAIVANSTSVMRPGSIILMHDAGGNRDQDLEALPRIIEAWQNAGYRFVTVEELMASDSSIPEECCANYRTMPEDAVWPTEIAS